MEETARLKRRELTAPEKSVLATTETNDICDGNNERKIEQRHEATSASLDEHFPSARRIGLEVRHSGDAPR